MPNVDEALKIIISARDEASSVLDMVTDKIEAQNKALESFSIKLPLLSKAVTAALAASTTMVAKHTEALEKMGLQADITFKHMRELEGVARKSGVSLESLVALEVRLKQIGSERASADEKKIRREMMAIGIAKDQNELSNETFKVVLRLAEAYKNAADKTAFFDTMTKALGNDFRELAPLFKSATSEIIKFSMVEALSEKDKKSLEEYSKALLRMKIALADLNTALGVLGAEGFAFVINMMAGFAEWLKKIVDFIAPLIKFVISVGARLAWLAVIIRTTVVVSLAILGTALVKVSAILIGTFYVALMKAALAAIGLQAVMFPIIGLIAVTVAAIGAIIYVLLKWKGTSVEAADGIGKDFDSIGADADRTSGKVGGAFDRMKNKMDDFRGAFKKSRDIFGETMEQLYNLPEALGLVSTMGLMKAEEAMKAADGVRGGGRSRETGHFGTGDWGLESGGESLIYKISEFFSRLNFNITIVADEYGTILEKDIARNVPNVM